MTGARPSPAFGPAYELLLELEEQLGTLRHGAEGVDPHATAALHAVRFAAAILQPAIPATEPPPFPHSTERLLQLMANWREAALELGEFAPAPTLQLLPGGKDT
ncbi:hypothetical protein [Streptomyces sp. NBC_01428]|uniref:hypothetical protein n=1 Tax=Streptomyces sp. NBC_01428 TaxID=2903861 RepID=UPI002E2FCD71|nr:hypothetical protein [Streptomyces sp. NBC_01428]